MRFMTKLIRCFVYITTGIVFVFIVMLLIEDGDGISTQTLITIPCAAFAVALMTTVIYAKEAVSKNAFYIRIAIHYVLICVVMLIFGTAFGWVEFDLAGVMTIAISTAVIYVFTFSGVYISSKNEAEKLNRALQRKREQKK